VDKLEYFFRLVNQMSGPAKAMKSDVEKLNDAIEDAGKALKDLDVQAKKTKLEKTVDPLKRQKLQLELNKHALHEQAQALKTAEKAAGGYTLGTDIMSGVIQRAIGGVTAFAAKTVELGVAGAKFATDAIAFKEQTLTALRVMTGTEVSAQRIFGQALEFAKKTPFDTRDVLGGFTQLLGAGFKESEVSTVFAAIGDAAAASGFDQQVIDRMVTAFAQIRAKGRLMGGEMLQVNEALGKAGVGTMAIYDQIGKRMGKTRAEVIKLQEAGGVDADSAIFGIIKALEQKSGGAVGNLMAEQSKTLKGLMSTLASAPGDFFMSMDLTNLPGFESVKGFVSNLVNLFDTGSKSGQRLQEVAGKLYNTVMVGLFGDMGDAGGLATMERITLRIADAVEGALPAIRNFLALVKGFGTGLLGGLLTGMERAGGLSKVMGGGPEAARLAEDFGQKVGTLATKIFGLADAVLFLLQPMVKLAELFGGGGKPVLDPASASQQGFSWGASLTAGLKDGILQNLTGPVNATDLMVAAIKGGYEAGTETHSPSRLFARYGAWATEGWAMGLESGIPGAEAAVDRMVGAADGAEVDASGAAGGAGARLGGNTIHLTVPLQVLAGAREDVEDLGPRLRDFLMRELPAALGQVITLESVQVGG
jgi:tape measure domain-containing protein